MKQKYILGMLALAMVSVLGISMISAYGFGNSFMNSDLSDEEIEEMQQERDAMHEAIENGDYSTWANLMQTRIQKMQGEITQERFNEVVDRYDEMSQVHELREELRVALEDGDDELIEELRIQLEELMPENRGFGMHAKQGRGMGKGFQNGEGMGMRMQLHDNSCLE